MENRIKNLTQKREKKYLLFYFVFLSFSFTFVMNVSCTKKKSENTETTISTPKPSNTKIPEHLQAEARKLFKSRCVTCHGERGAGDGPASKGLTPPPKDFTSASWQKTVTNEYLEKIIKLGGASVGKSAAMPPNPDLNGKPELVQALVQFIRSLEN